MGEEIRQDIDLLCLLFSFNYNNSLAESFFPSLHNDFFCWEKDAVMEKGVITKAKMFAQ